MGFRLAKQPIPLLTSPFKGEEKNLGERKGTN